MKLPRTYIDSLDGIRALSFLLVFFSHAGMGDKIPGGLGVTIFFFLSGYLITTLLRRELLATTGRIDLKQFYMRRVLRIFPPFYTVLLVATVLTWLWILPYEPSWQGLLSQFLYVNNYYGLLNSTPGFPGGPGTAIYWSLAVEEHFYAVFPFAFLLLCRKVPRPIGRAAWILGACLIILLWRCVLVYLLHSPDIRTYVATDTRIDSILYGCALATCCNPAIDPIPDSPRARWGTGAVMLLGLCGMLVSLKLRDHNFRETFRYSLQGICLLPIFYGAVRYSKWILFRPLNWSVLRFVGVLSYSLYLVHFLILEAMTRVLPAILQRMPGNLSPDSPSALLLLQILALSLSVLAAYLIHIGIERPSARLKALLTARFEYSPTSHKASL